MMRTRAKALFPAFLTCLFLFAPSPSTASVVAQGGPYEVHLTTEPAVIPVGRANLLLEVRSNGQPVQGASSSTLLKMPGMNMGERETPAVQVPSRPGFYKAPVSFAMTGGYTATINIAGKQGTAIVTIPLETGQDTTEAGGGLKALLLWALLGGALLFVVYRVYKTGQRPSVRSLLNRGAVVGVLSIVGVAALAYYAVHNWRREGAMTPIEAQSMEMQTPAPPGSIAVTLARVEKGTVTKTVRYTGQAVGMSEIDVSARTQGWLISMPLYVGDRVTAGQVIGRLDTSQVAPQVAERRAAVNMAERGVDVMRREYGQALADANRMRSEVAAKRDAVGGGQAELIAAREEKANAEAELASMRTMTADAEAGLEGARADQTYRRQELARAKELLDKGAISKSEHQQEVSMAAGADSKVRQAVARRDQVRAQIRAAEAGVRKAEAMVVAAEKKLRQMGSDVRAAEAAVRAAEAMAQAKQSRIGEARAGVGQAEAGLAAVNAVRGYSEIRAPISGVVTQRLSAPGVLLNPGQAVVRIAQADPIRIQANVAESDLDRVHIGSSVAIQMSRDSAPVNARVTSITPAVDPVARTGIVEAVVPNREGRFRPGQFVTLEIQAADRRSGLRIPVAALSARGGSVHHGSSSGSVWLAEPGGGQFTVRRVEVEIGASDGKFVELLSGLEEGQQVVVSGGQFLSNGDVVTAGESSSVEQAGGGSKDIRVTVSAGGFSPSTVLVKAGKPVRVTFVRTDEKNCGNQILLPEYNILKDLPLNKPVVVEFTPRKTGDVQFTCGMKMMKGKVVVQ
jgi:RND family efflux transporter MFP subunit